MSYFTKEIRKIVLQKKNLLYCLFSVISVLAFSQKQNADKIIGVVGDNIVLRSEVNAQFQQLLAQSKTDGYIPNEEDKCRIFDNLLLEKLFVAQAILDSVMVTPDEIDAELDRRVKYFQGMFGSREKLEAYYGKTVSELKDDFTDDVKSQLLADKMKGKIYQGLKVTPAEVKEFFAKIPKDSVPYFNSEIEMGQIVMFPKVSDEAKTMAKEKLEKIRKEIIAGDDFSLKAILYSEDPGSATDGGNLGVVARGELVPDFEAVAFKLEEKKVSDIVETPFGFHIILVDEKMGDKLKLRHILMKPKLTDDDVRVVQNRMDSILNQLRTDSMTFKEAVGKFSEEETSKSIGGIVTNQKNGTTYFEKAEIEGNLIFTLDRMKVGDYSDVLRFQTPDRSGETKNGFRIIWLKSESKPHKASLETDYAKIQSATKQKKQQEILQKWIDLNKDHTFIKVDKDYQNCAILEKWFKEN